MLPHGCVDKQQTSSSRAQVCTTLALILCTCRVSLGVRRLSWRQSTGECPTSCLLLARLLQLFFYSHLQLCVMLILMRAAHVKIMHA
jgi:hypothetical protein